MLNGYFWGVTQRFLQAHVQPSRRQSGLVAREQLSKVELNPVEVNNRKALAELNEDEVRKRTNSGFNQFQLDALSEHNICRCVW